MTEKNNQGPPQPEDPQKPEKPQQNSFLSLLGNFALGFIIGYVLFKLLLGA